MSSLHVRTIHCEWTFDQKTHKMMGLPQEIEEETGRGRVRAGCLPEAFLQR